MICIRAQRERETRRESESPFGTRVLALLRGGVMSRVEGTFLPAGDAGQLAAAMLQSGRAAYNVTCTAGVQGTYDGLVEPTGFLVFPACWMQSGYLGSRRLLAALTT